MTSLLPQTPGLTDRRALIVEDEGITQMQIRRILFRAGMQVIGEAWNGQDAVEIALRERPDLILMDINMPLLNGLEAGRRIREVYPASILFLTAYANEEFQRQALALGASGYLMKPINADILLQQLERLVSASAPNAQAHIPDRCFMDPAS